jgi:cell division septal protein FtsQ
MKQLRKKKNNDNAPRRRSGTLERDSVEFTNQFRRGRTITGSSSSRISSGNELNADILSPRAQSHHLNLRRRKLVLRLIGVIVAALIVYVCVGQIIANVQVKTNELVNASQSQQYAKALDGYFAKHPVERFRPSLNETSMVSYLQQTHPEIKSADVHLLSGFGDAQLEVTLRQPIARWTINGANEYVDETGTVFAQNAHSSDMIEIIDTTGPRDGIVASKRFLGFVGLIVGDMKLRGYKVVRATIPALTTRQLEVTLENIPYTFKLSTDRSAGEQSEDISRIITYLKGSQISPGYVDVRVKGKAFYK